MSKETDTVTEVERDPVGFLPEPREELIQYRSLNRLALGGMALGAISWLALISPLLWLVPLVAVIVSCTALRRIASAPSQWTGRGLALTGLTLAVFFGIWAVAQHVSRQRVLTGQTRAHADRVIQFIQSGNLEEVFQLSLAKDVRLGAEVDVQQFFEENPESKREFEMFFGSPPISEMVAAGEQGQYRYTGTRFLWRTPYVQDVEALYQFSYPANQGTRQMRIAVRLQREFDPDTREAVWVLTRVASEK